MKVPKYFNCDKCGIALPIYKEERDRLEVVMKSPLFDRFCVFCKKCDPNIDKLHVCEHAL